ncbi:hypothetical protein ALIPUT_01208 [Alistipes putredinis DSM 17216]|uniref:Uncharacterized protein n=1 Tax=Alistipes putredinis DSM 17216 TaxID=445970 RepID=B0MVP6_9BACT|nr:hypothetical protein ALIPUT_01208 [Alistipes putredinis DSM 17216]
MKHEIGRKAFDITLYRLIESACCYLVQFRQITVQHHPLASYFVNFALDGLQFHIVVSLWLFHLYGYQFPAMQAGLIFGV